MADDPPDDYWDDDDEPDEEDDLYDECPSSDEALSEPPTADVAVVAYGDSSTYLKLVVEPKHGARQEYRISFGAADVLFHELAGMSGYAPSDEAGKLREALETIARNHDDFGTFSGTQCAEIARAALKAAKTARKM